MYAQLNQATAEQPSTPTLHGGIRRAYERLCDLTNNFENLIQRINGPRPVASGNSAKEDKEPSVAEYMERLHVLLTQIESQYQEFSKLIG